MKLKEIPQNIVVHTPTEPEAKELLAILHENGYRWMTDDSLLELINWDYNICYYIQPSKRLQFSSLKFAHREANTILTPAEFKERYCEEEKPHPKPKVGDRVKIKESYYKEELHGRIGIVTSRVTPFSSFVEIDKTIYQVSDRELEPYTEPETKEETMETKDDTKELNLCELLKGHEGERFYSSLYDNMVDIRLHRDVIEINYGVYNTAICSNGAYFKRGVCTLFPSRALYEQYPLDPYTAWMKWQEEQKKHWVSVTAWIDDIECESDTAIDTNKIYFRTPTDRDKCIEEIKAIIEKYSK